MLVFHLRLICWKGTLSDSMSSLVNIIFQIKRDALFGSDGATSVKRRKILPITETPCTSTTEPAMTEYARPDTSSGGPAGIETPGSSSMCFDVDVTPVSVSTEAQGREAGTAFSSLSIVRPGSIASTQPTPSGSGFQTSSKVPCTKCSGRAKKLKSLRKKHSRLQKKLEKLKEKCNQLLVQQVGSIHYLVMWLHACNFKFVFLFMENTCM